MKRKPSRPSAATSEFLLPQPSAAGVAKLRALYLTRTGREITEDQAKDVLSRIMRFQHLNILTNAPCSGTDSTPESPTTSRKLTEKSIGEQVAECRRLAEGEGLRIERVWEESRTARLPDNRPLWKDLVSEVRAGRIDAILCWNFNRLVRNMKEGGELVQLFVDGKLREIRTPYSRFRTGDNILPLVIEAATATQYSIDLRQVVKRSMDAKAASGGYNALAPQGYRNERDPANGKRGTVILDTERFVRMRKAWDLMLTGGHTVHAVAETLNRAWGYRTRPTPRGGNGPLSENALYRAFRNPFYAGLVLSKGELVRGRHKALVTPDEFRRVQDLLSRRTFKAAPGVVRPFTGVMSCAY